MSDLASVIQMLNIDSIDTKASIGIDTMSNSNVKRY